MELHVLKVPVMGLFVFVVLLNISDGGDDYRPIHLDVDAVPIAHRHSHADAHIVVDAVCDADFRVSRRVCHRKQLPVIVQQADFPHVPAAHIGRDGGCRLDDVLVLFIQHRFRWPAPHLMYQRGAGWVRHRDAAISVTHQHIADGDLLSGLQISCQLLGSAVRQYCKIFG